ncbi:MAG: hypothetical protein IPK13_10595 [Deltaproteobacteria bacterium]|nr:hypothetical protein [Deltaproteobacteria bacterium]
MRSVPGLFVASATTTVVFVVGCGGGGDASVDPLAGLTVVQASRSDLPISALSDAWRERFSAGDVRFEAVHRPANGLGPVYIRQACASCHADDGRGPGAVRKMSVVEADGITMARDQSALRYGHTVRPQTTATEIEGVDVPDDVVGLKVTTRLPPAVFGRGYIEAIADSEIERLEQAQAARDDGISGRINRVPYQSRANDDVRFHAHSGGEPGLIGRFGLKARIATIDDFTADAYQGDMGLTSPLRPDELPTPNPVEDGRPGEDLDLETVNLVADYVRLLAIPERSVDNALGAEVEQREAVKRDADVASRGRVLFDDVLCAVCHVPSLRTASTYPIEAIAGQDVFVFTDLLLHDMGDDLSDGLVEFDASEREWRTAPLIGLRFSSRYLHDGRAATVDEAIRMHEGEGSEANESARLYAALPDDDRARLLAFVEGL